jgi:hypothetical protein
MTLNLNVLNHLGLNLYSNIPAVLSEVVANSWDADATEVHITFTNNSIVIRDNGHGMTRDDVNNQYLNVGYERRRVSGGFSAVRKRPVMGRKGIGKLSLFSIADYIEIHTCRDGEKTAFVLDLPSIQAVIKSNTGLYNPAEIPPDIDRDGTTIVLCSLKRKVTASTPASLKKRISRRFTIIGNTHSFVVTVNGEPIAVTDRDYFHKLENIWCYSQDAAQLQFYRSQCLSPSFRNFVERPTVIEGTGYHIGGWIGTVVSSGDLRDMEDSLNRIVIMVRGKLAQENILNEYPEGGLYSKYLLGEIYADFLDVDNEPDIATSSRQDIIKDDPRYEALKNHIYRELKHIQMVWTEYREKTGKDEAIRIPAVQRWYEGLGADNKKKAQKLFGQLNQLTVDPAKRKELFKLGVIAFENLRYKENLDALEHIRPENFEELAKFMSQYNDIEATLYYQIVAERMRVIRLLQEKVDSNARERVVQEHIFNHLWLLDPSWDRAATDSAVMEARLGTLFKQWEGQLSQEEREARLDIKYRKTSHRHVIIELKRSGVKPDKYKLLEQVEKYRKAVQKVLKDMNKENEPLEIICLVGRAIVDDPQDALLLEEQFALNNARIIHYDAVIRNAESAYSEFLKKHEEAGRLTKLLSEIDEFQLNQGAEE